MIKHLFLILAMALNFAEGPSVIWNSEVRDLGNRRYELVLRGDVGKEYYTHPMDDEWSATTLEINSVEGLELLGPPSESYEASDYKGTKVVRGTYVIIQPFMASEAVSSISGTLGWSSCSGDACRTPEDWEFVETVHAAPVLSGTPAGSAAGNSSLWSLILEAILWGFAMLLTPCVFPMVPMTVSFFMKGSESPAQGRFKAFFYGLCIVLLYTVPISVIIGLTWLLGGPAVTADIFNWLATHWLPNILFFIVFMVFAASFFGAFEITLPSSWVNKSDRNSGKKGLAGIFFLALTLVLVSFSCTGPIVGTVLIKSTSGEFWAPMVTMLAFSVAFALPFTLLALFPSLLKNLPKSGGWLNSVKVVLGFIEVALGFKFLSVADQTYHWHLLDREVYLAIWIAVFSSLGLYLIGKIRFKHDSPLEYLSVGRLTLSIAVFAFVVYLIPGMWGAPLKALSGYLPPIETQDFVMTRYQGPAAEEAAPSAEADAILLPLPHGLSGYNTIEAALDAAKTQGKPVFVDITGHGCVNCREMEARVWSDPQVRKILAEDYVIAVLYMDDKTKLPSSRWVTTGAGKVLKDVGRVNSHIAATRFGVNAQPNYALLSPEGELLAPVRGYDLSVPGFVEFLQSGLQ
ncbi:MAG: thioredoxin family protein [Bacteroidales bacterium]|nr:thioredoxin family protein [Bacteroidales bacterium]